MATQIHQVVLAASAADLHEAALAAGTKLLAHGLRAFAMPLTPDDYLEAAEDGTLQVLATSGWTICPPSDTFMAALAEGESGVTTLRTTSSNQRQVMPREAALAAVTGQA